MVNTPPSANAAGYRPVAEWTQHGACITAWPAHEYAWGPHLHAAQREVAAFLHQVAEGDGAESIDLLCANEHAERDARAALIALGPRVRYLRLPYGDTWLRDTGPIFLRRADGAIASARFAFNGWGGKYNYPDDDCVADAVARALGLPQFVSTLVLEGGALELDGEGTCLTTSCCLLNDNRNPGRSRAQIERVLYDMLAVDKVLWLERGLAGDHTDGHIDNLARFVAPATVLCARPDSASDPNHDVLREIESKLGTFTDAHGRALSLLPVPSVGAILDADGAPHAASYLNFYIGNRSVIVPAFGVDQDEDARAAIARAFPTRRVVLSSARAILEGGGTLHCTTRQRPELAT